MKTTLQDLEAHTAEYIRRAAAGEEITVTEDGAPLARLTAAPTAQSPDEAEAAAVARIRAMPGIRAGIDGRPPLPEPVLHIGPGEKSLADIVSEMRG